MVVLPRFRIVLCAAAVLGFAVACSDDESTPGSQSGTERQTRARGLAESAELSLPELRDVSLRPNVPEPNKAIHAVPRLVDSLHKAEFDFEWTVDGDSNYPNAPAIDLPMLDGGARVSVRVVPRNEAGAGEGLSIVGVVANTAPRIDTLEVTDDDSSGSHRWHASVEASDANGDSVEFEYAWFVNGEKSSQNDAWFNTAELARGDQLYVEVVAHDDFDESRPVRSGVLSIDNAAPEITSVPHGLSQTGSFAYEITVVDPDGDSDLTYTLVKGPRGMELSRWGALHWLPESDQAGDHDVVVTVSDGRGGEATQEFVLPVRRVVERETQSPAATD